MAWEMVAIWVIVVATLVWFVRDEKRRRADARIAEAARYYAHAPSYRHRAVEPPAAVPLPPRRTGGLDSVQRNYLRSMLRAED